MIALPGLDAAPSKGRHNARTATPFHLADATMFWAPASGGVKRYLTAKSQWLSGQPAYRHTIVVPGALRGQTARDARVAAANVQGNRADPAAASPAAPAFSLGASRLHHVPGLPLPFSHGYRVTRGRGSAARALRELAPDLIEANDPYQLAWAALDAGQACGVPVVAFYHSDLARMASDLAGSHANAVARRLAERYVRHLYNRFDAVFAPSRTVARALADMGVERVVRQPLGVNTTVFDPSRRNARWRGSLGIAPGDRVLIYAGRYAPEKNLHVITDAVRRAGPGHVLVTLGAGPTPPSGPGVIVLPYQGSTAALAEAMASADAMIHAGDQETFGLVALEAMACGLPVIACQAAGMGELVDDAVGQAVEHCTGAAFADTIAGLFARDLGPVRAAARARAEHYDWRAVLPRLMSHYQRVAQRQDLLAVEAREVAHVTA